MEIVDEQTGEVRAVAPEQIMLAPPPATMATLRERCERIRARMADVETPLSSLPSDLAHILAFAREFYAWAKSCEAVALRRMVLAGAREITDGNGAVMRRAVKREYEYDEKALLGLAHLIGKPDGLTIEEYETALRNVLKVDKRALNKLSKRGGQVKATIDAATRTLEADVLEVEKGRDE